MAFRTRQQQQMARPTAAATGVARSALGNIQNKLTTFQGRPVPVKGHMTRSHAALQKENPKPPQQKMVAPVQAKQIVEKQEQDTEDLNKSLMDISIVEEPQPTAFSTSLLPVGVSAIDTQDVDNQFLCSEYVMDIYQYLHEMEVEFCVRPNFLSKQKEITPRMRAILIDWLNQVHTRFNLNPETLYLTVALIDRFLQELEVSRTQLQLVGITAMFIASKYEEMYSPEVSDFVYIADNAYSKRDIFKMECLILKTLRFSLGRPLPLHFLRRDSKAGDCDAVVHTVAKFLMELALQDYELASVAPSQLAAAALRLSLTVMDEAPWTQDLAFYSGYTEEQLMPTVRQLARLLLRNFNSKLQAVQKKYASSKLMRISSLPQLRSQVLEQLANLGP